MSTGEGKDENNLNITAEDQVFERIDIFLFIIVTDFNELL